MSKTYNAGSAIELFLQNTISNNKQEEVQEQEDNSVILNSAEKEVSSIGITAKKENIDLFSMISNINNQNTEYTEKELEKEKEAYALELEKEKEKALEKKRLAAEEIFKKEQAERDRIYFEEQQAEAERILRLQEKRNNSIFNKTLKNIIPSKPQKENSKEIKKTEEPVETSKSIIEEEIVETSNVKEFEETNVSETPEIEIPSIPLKSSSKFVFKLNKKKKEDLIKKPEETIESDITPEPISEPVLVSESVPEPESEFISEPVPEPVDVSKSKIKNEKSKVFKNSPFSKKSKLEKEDVKAEEDKAIDWEYVALHDEMTKLRNARAYSNAIKECGNQECLVIYVDVNNLKYNNDLYGHEAGNELITAVSSEIYNIYGECAYRTGGDEFVCIVYGAEYKKAKKNIDSDVNTILSNLDSKISENYTGLVFSASIGYAYGSPIKEIIAEAEAKMYQAKKIYKTAHPEFMTSRDKKPSSVKKEVPKKDVPYDELLSEAQRNLKSSIKEAHTFSGACAIDTIIGSIQSRWREIIAIFVTSPDFNNLFILNNAQTFINLAGDMKEQLDYSYIYALFKGGPQYYGADEYNSQITHLFEDIGSKIAEGKIRNQKDLLKIPGINIFENIFME